MSEMQRILRRENDRGDAGVGDGRYGPLSEGELDAKIGGLPQSALDLASDVTDLGEGCFQLVSSVKGCEPSTSSTVVGGYGSFCSLFSGMLPLEAGMRLYRNSKAKGGVGEDVCGLRRGVSKMVTGGAVIFGSFFSLVSRVISVALQKGALMTPELLMAGEAAGVLGMGLGVVTLFSMVGFFMLSVLEGLAVRKEVEGIISKSSNKKEALDRVKTLLHEDSLFSRRLLRTTKQKVLDEINQGQLNEKTKIRWAKKEGAINPEVDPAGAVLQHFFLKLDKRIKVNRVMIVLCVFSLSLAVAGVVMSGGIPLLVLTALGIVSSLMWFSVDLLSFVKELKKGKPGLIDRAVLLVSTAFLVGLVVISALVSTGMVGLVVMASLAVICMGLQLKVFRASKQPPSFIN